MRDGPEARQFYRALRSLRARLFFQTLGRVRGPVSRPEDFVGLGRLNASGSFGPGVNLRFGGLVAGPVRRAAKRTGPYGALGPGEIVRPWDGELVKPWDGSDSGPQAGKVHRTPARTQNVPSVWTHRSGVHPKNSTFQHFDISTFQHFNISTFQHFNIEIWGPPGSESKPPK